MVTQIWVHIAWLAQVVASCLMVQSHYLNQCSLITNMVLWHSPENYSTETILKILIIKLHFKIKHLKSKPHLSWDNEFIAIFGTYPWELCLMCFICICFWCAADLSFRVTSVACGNHSITLCYWSPDILTHSFTAIKEWLLDRIP